MRAFVCVQVMSCGSADNSRHLSDGQDKKSWFELSYLERGFQPLKNPDGSYVFDKKTGEAFQVPFQRLAKLKSLFSLDVAEPTHFVLELELTPWAMNGKSGLSSWVVSSHIATPDDVKRFDVNPFQGVK